MPLEDTRMEPPGLASDNQLPAGDAHAATVSALYDRPPCIMLVDDDPVIIEVLRVHLDDAGYRGLVTTTESRDALPIAIERNPDLLLLDLMMPGMSGFEVLEALRADPRTRHLPVIVLTSSTEPAAKLRALELGATDFLGKPVDASELALRVRNTLAVKAYQDQLAHADHVTGLANRRRFLAVLERALSQVASGQRPCAVLQLGVDRFRQLNDALGYGAGDRVLREVGARLRARLASMIPGSRGAPESTCTIARTGGDEFMVLIPRLEAPDVANRMASVLRESVAEPLAFEGETLFLRASVGVALARRSGDDVDSLLARAGQALSYAKKRGGDRCESHSDEIDSWASERLGFERDLRVATQREALSLAYQPKIRLGDERIVGAEALLRWHHPTRGLVSPGEFIPLAEETGLIVPIGAWVLREACLQASDWQRRGFGTPRIAVNVSARQFRESDLGEVVQAALAHSGLAPGSLTLEVTESMLMADPEDAARTLEALAAIGVQVSVDDFGTGYSSLAYLKRFHVDELKIDRSFVRDIPDSEDDAAIVTAVIAMAHGLGLEVVAEGVETPDQLAFLERLGCDRVQGFLFSRPVDARDLVEQLAASHLGAPTGCRLAG